MTVTAERCECDDAYHGPDGCKNAPHDHGPDIRTSPELCMPCLHCCGEDDE